MTTKIMNETSKSSHEQLKFEKEDKKAVPFSGGGKESMLDDTGSSVIYHQTLLSKIKKQTIFFIFIPAIPIILIFLCFLLLFDQKVLLFDSSSKPLLSPSPSPLAPTIPPKLKMIHRLPTNLYPSLYILTLQIFLPYKPGVDFGPRNLSVVGSVIINFECRQDTNEIFLNINNILIKNDSLKLGDQDTNQSLNVEVELIDQLAQILKLRTFPTMKKGGNYTLLIHYGTRVRSPQEGGLFLAKYHENNETKYHVMSQMQPIESRRVFPCFDEPSFKARFQINVIHPTGTTAISNAEATDKLEYETNWTRTEFDISPIMSTYLIGIAVTDFQFIETTYRDIKLRIWTQPKFVNETRTALSILPKGLKFYENYFNITYPLSKLDIYAVKELRVAAMENWGLITVRESVVVFNPKIGSAAESSMMAMTILHELAHMWFGNLITMRWWNDLWLNEGFACHMSYKAMREVTPKVDIDYYVHFFTFTVLNIEEKQKTSPLSSNITKNGDIFLAFSRISYHKGAAIIHMFESFVGEKVFRHSLQSFIKHHFYDNAVSADFAKSIGRTMKHLNTSFAFGNQGIVGALKSWTRRPGFPEIIVKRINETAVELSQKSCCHNFFVNTTDQPYSIPIFYSQTDNNNLSSVMLNNDEKVIINNLALVDPYYSGYYKVCYDEQAWLQIARQLRQNHLAFPVEARTRLIFDSYSLAISGRINITTGLEVTAYIKNEIEHGAINVFLLSIDSYRHIFWGNETGSLLTKYYASVLIPIFERVISEEGKNIDEQVKKLIILKLCLLNYEPCIDYVKDVFFQAFTDCRDSLMSDFNCNKVEVGYRSTIYAISVKYGNKEIFEFIWKKYLAETNDVEKERLLLGVAGVRDIDSIKLIMEHAIAVEEHTICMQFYNVNNLELLRSYLMKNFEFFVQKAQKQRLFAICLHAIYKFPQTDYLIQEMEEFEVANKVRTSPAIWNLLQKPKKENIHNRNLHNLYDSALKLFLNEYVLTL